MVRILKIKAESRRNDFARGIRANVRALWIGEYNLYNFIDGMFAAIERYYRFAFYEGAEQMGISPGELTIAELHALRFEINSQVQYITPFGDEIERNSKANGGKLTPLMYRAEMWSNRYDAVKSLAISMTGRDQKLKWIWNPIKEHCNSCAKLNGRVYRASTWARYNIEPQSFRLECKGFRCGCVWEVTTDPCTPGRPPSIP